MGRFNKNVGCIGTVMAANKHKAFKREQLQKLRFADRFAQNRLRLQRAEQEAERTRQELERQRRLYVKRIGSQAREQMRIDEERRELDLEKERWQKSARNGLDGERERETVHWQREREYENREKEQKKRDEEYKKRESEQKKMRQELEKERKKVRRERTEVAEKKEEMTKRYDEEEEEMQAKWRTIRDKLARVKVMEAGLRKIHSEDARIVVIE